MFVDANLGLRIGVDGMKTLHEQAHEYAQEAAEKYLEEITAVTEELELHDHLWKRAYKEAYREFLQRRGTAEIHSWWTGGDC